MKSRDALIRLKRFEVEEKRRKVAEIEAMIGDFNHMALDLDRQIAIEQERAGVSDVNHYAYPTFAKAAIQRRDDSADFGPEPAAKLAAARGDFDGACEERTKIELLEERQTRNGCGSSRPEPRPRISMWLQPSAWQADREHRSPRLRGGAATPLR